MITIVNYGLGNLGSIQNMLKKIGYQSVITSDESEIYKAEKIILPGVGHFDAAMRKIRELELYEVLNHKAKTEKIPILGICLGMQILGKSSEEGIEKGFGWIDAEIKRFKFDIDSKLKIPHMGWNYVSVSNDCPLTKGFDDEFKYYFVHSYHAKTINSKNVFLKCEYGYEFDAAIFDENIYGVQFHPEKSHRYGQTILKNFAQI